MEAFLSKRMTEHTFNYKQSLNRIIDKYSRFRSNEEDLGLDVDLDHVDFPTLESYLQESKKKISQLEAESLTNLSEESYSAGGSTAQAVTRHSRQQDLTQDDDDGDMSAESISQFSTRDNETTRSDATRLTLSSLDESRRNFSEVELQPEDEDEELEMSLSGHGNFMLDLYPGMISSLGNAWRRQHASEAAGVVLKRYRKWRLHPKRGSLNKTFVAPARLDSTRENRSPAKAPLLRVETDRRSPLKMGASLCDRQQQQSPWKARASPGKARHRPILVMDVDSSSDSEGESSLNETFTVAQLSPTKHSQRRERSPYSGCYYSPQKAPASPSPQFKPLPSPSRSVHSAGYSAYSPKTAAARVRPALCGSPVRQSPSNARVPTGRSPPLFYSPRRRSVEPARPRSLCASPSSPSRRPAAPVATQCPRESPRSFRPEPRSPQPAAAPSGPHRLRRHLSLDSSLASVGGPLSSQQLDAQVKWLYHKYVCQRKSAFPHAPPCRQCAERARASRGHSSSVLSALALSPHGSVQRKRFREQGCSSSSASKRLKEECWPRSPGSMHRGNPMLRRCLYPEDFEPRRGGGVAASGRSNHGVSHRFTSQQLPTHLDSSMTFY